MKLTKFIVVLTFLLAPALNISGQMPTNILANSADDSYAIYSILINKFEFNYDHGGEVKLHIIRKFTNTESSSRFSPDKVIRNHKVVLSSEFKAAVKDFKAKNKKPEKLEGFFNLKQDYLLISYDDSEKAFTTKDSETSWEAFYRNYPNSSGLIEFSRVGFDAQKKNAFVYMFFRCGDLCVESVYFFFTKEQGVWKETNKVVAWVS